MAKNKTEERVSFSHFVDQFPEIELPFTLGEETHLLFSRENKPLPELMIEQHILPFETEERDEFTEYVPCFRLPKTEGYVGLVYWRAGLLNYQYVLLTLNRKEEMLIDRRVLAGTFYDGEELTQSAATMTEERIIYIVSGQNQLGVGEYQAAQSTATRLQVTEQGKIVEL